MSGIMPSNKARKKQQQKKDTSLKEIIENNMKAYSTCTKQNELQTIVCGGGGGGGRQFRALLWSVSMKQTKIENKILDMDISSHKQSLHLCTDGRLQLKLHTFKKKNHTGTRNFELKKLFHLKWVTNYQGKK